MGIRKNSLFIFQVSKKLKWDREEEKTVVVIRYFYKHEKSLILKAQIFLKLSKQYIYALFTMCLLTANLSLMANLSNFE